MRKFLLYSSALAVFGLSSSVAEAACIQTPTCSSLGYTSTSSCTGGTKCPFGNYWNCDSVNKITELTNKITELEKIIEEIKQNSSSNSDILSNCTIGDILYSDKSCDPNVIASKKPIGVVFDRASKLAIGLEESRKYWAYDDFDVPGLSNITSSSTVTADWQGKNNTRVVLEYCKTNGKSCPAFEYVNSYKTEGTQAGDWYLPAFGELNAIYGNKDVLNIALGKIGGTKLETGDDYWSSSEHSDNIAWGLRFSDGSVDYRSKYSNNDYVRPVINFGDWANSSAGDEEDASPTCNVGDIFYSDMTCNANMVASKTPIGVVFDATNRLIIGLEQSHQYWSYPDYFDVPGVENITSSTLAITDLDGKKNTSTILAYCKTKGKSCPAFEYVNSYKTEGTKAGDWYLPSMGELYAIYGNMGVLNVALGKIAATRLTTSWYWSSSENSTGNAWRLYFSNGNVDYGGKNGSNDYVRPVMQY